MPNAQSNLLHESADNADLLACLMAAYESYGARDPLAACVGGRAESEGGDE